jgi:hypothetical protein
MAQGNFECKRCSRSYIVIAAASHTPRTARLHLSLVAHSHKKPGGRAGQAPRGGEGSVTRGARSGHLVVGVGGRDETQSHARETHGLSLASIRKSTDTPQNDTKQDNRKKKPSSRAWAISPRDEREP